MIAENLLAVKKMKACGRCTIAPKPLKNKLKHSIDVNGISRLDIVPSQPARQPTQIAGSGCVNRCGDYC